MSRVLIVVGRAKNELDFGNRVSLSLYDNFNLEIVYPLGEPGIDGKERFIGFITGEEMGGYSLEALQMRLQADTFGANIYDSMEEAMQEAKEKYGLGVEDEARTQKLIRLKEKFPQFTAKESEDMFVTNAILKNGPWAAMRGLLGEEEIPVVVVVLVIEGPDDVIVKPLVVLATDELMENIVLPKDWDG